MARHEAYVRLVDGDGARRWDSRGHFFSAAAEAMRRILVENYRRKHRIKRGGDQNRVNGEDAIQSIASPVSDLVALDDALDCQREGGWSCLSRCAMRCNTPIRRGSFTVT